MKKALMIVVIFAIVKPVIAQKTYSIASPSGAIQINISSATKLTWSVTSKSQNILAPSVIAMHLNTGEVLGDNAQITSTKKENIIATIPALFYKKNSIAND